MPDGSTDADAAKLPRTRSILKRVRRFLVMLIAVYLSITLMLTFIQRKLIYIPRRDVPVAEPGDFIEGQLADVVIPTDDDLELHGWLSLRGGATFSSQNDLAAAVSANGPFVIYFPGNAGHRGYRLLEFQMFNKLGCDMLLVDYRGYGGNPGQPTEVHFAGDAHSIWRYVTEQLKVDPQRIIIAGESLGGGVAVRLASELCERKQPPAGLVLRGTFSSLVDVAAYHYPWLPVRWVLLDRYPSIDRINRITCPILQFHGDQDRVVPIGQGRQLHEAAPPQSANGIEKKFITLAGLGHNNIMYMAAGVVREHVRSFIDALPEFAPQPIE